MNRITNFTPAISVVVPVYCAEKYIDRCVKSILNQSETDIEVWLIDDGSPDKSGEICDRLAAQDSRISVMHKSNMGVSAARNDGISLAKGKYISFIDADDYIEPTMLSHLYNEAENCGADIAMCGYYIDNAKHHQTAELCCKEGLYDLNSIHLLFQKFFESNTNGLASMCNKLYKRDFLINNILLVDTSLKRAEDFWFNFYAIKAASMVTVNSAPFYHYVQNSESVMHRCDVQLFEHWTKNRKKLLDEAINNNITVDNNIFFYNYIYNCVLLLLDLSRKKQYRDVMRIMSDSFFVSSLSFSSTLPMHIKFISFLLKFKLRFSALIILKIWSLIHNGQQPNS